MDYYKLFNLEKEPFSNTPDPDFFYRSAMHSKCLMNLEIALRLRRGLCIVHGEVGTGKTTLCRQLIRVLAENDEMRVHLLLDPNFDTPLRFAAAVNEMFCGAERAGACETIGEHREMIKQYLFGAGVDLGKIVVLIVDEAQKLPGDCIEFLRELLNYETNEYKLLQIVLFAQNEITDLLVAHPNFEDRVAFYHHLGPLDRGDTAKLIRFRLKKAGGRGNSGASAPIFTGRGIASIHRLSGGYPRKMIHLSHNILLLLLIKGKTRVTPAIVRQAAQNMPSGWGRGHGIPLRRGFAFAAAGMGAALVLVGFSWFFTVSGPAGDFAGARIGAMFLSPGGNAGMGALPAPATMGMRDAAPPVDAPGQVYTPQETRQHGNLEPDAAMILPPVSSHLGKIRIRQNETLWRIAERIYGHGSEMVLEMVKQANPGMDNPNLIRPGQVVSFPVAGHRFLEPGERYWIALEKGGDFEWAYRFFVAAAASADDLRLVSFLMPSGESLHAVVKGEGMPDMTTAETILAGLPPHIQNKSTVLNMSLPGVRRMNPAGIDSTQ